MVEPKPEQKKTTDTDETRNIHIDNSPILFWYIVNSFHYKEQKETKQSMLESKSEQNNPQQTRNQAVEENQKSENNKKEIENPKEVVKATEDVSESTVTKQPGNQFNEYCIVNSFINISCSTKGITASRA